MMKTFEANMVKDTPLFRNPHYIRKETGFILWTKKNISVQGVDTPMEGSTGLFFQDGFELNVGLLTIIF